jgi:hypothetical protein
MDYSIYQVLANITATKQLREYHQPLMDTTNSVLQYKFTAELNVTFTDPAGGRYKFPAYFHIVEHTDDGIVAGLNILRRLSIMPQTDQPIPHAQHMIEQHLSRDTCPVPYCTTHVDLILSSEPNTMRKLNFRCYPIPHTL